jgi:hypothetical protein
MKSSCFFFRCFLSALTLLALLSCASTGGPAPENAAPKPAAEPSRGDAAPARESSFLPFRPDPGLVEEIRDHFSQEGLPAAAFRMIIDEPMTVPARVTYLPAEPLLNREVVARFLATLDEPGVLASFQGDSPLVVGPYLVALLDRAGLLEELDYKLVIMTGMIGSTKHTLVSIVPRPPSVARVLSLLRNIVFCGEGGVVRRLTARELDWYWTIISWDIEEPIVVFTNARHRLMVNFDKDGKLFFVELFDNLLWGGEQEGLVD